MDLTQLLVLLCYYGPTPIAGILAGMQAVQCKSPWQAFVVALVGTIVLALVIGFGVDLLPIWGVGYSAWHMWQLHLIISAVVAVPLAAFCAYLVEKRSRPPSDVA